MDNISLSKRGGAVRIIDQSLLPNELRYIELQSKEEMHDAIVKLRVRGAPAIGIFAAYCVYVLARGIGEDDFLGELRDAAAFLRNSRPTAVNLPWALERMIKRAEASSGFSREERLAALESEALAIHNEDIAMCRAISENGLSLLKPGDGILTHCNAGPLATSRYGTALGPILLGKERGIDFKVFAGETRPLLQGARLTAFELGRAGVDVTLICDSMAAAVMKNGWISACMVGCDRIARNGDTANKIGTSAVAVLARHYDIPFYVLGPSSTIDLGCESGADIEIELRPPEEIRSKFYERPMSPETVKCYNPAFDVTDSSLITAIITEKGVHRPPYANSISGGEARLKQATSAVP